MMKSKLVKWSLEVLKIMFVVVLTILTILAFWYAINGYKELSRNDELTRAYYVWKYSSASEQMND